MIKSILIAVMALMFLAGCNAENGGTSTNNSSDSSRHIMKSDNAG